jgi:hypothetical protein
MKYRDTQERLLARSVLLPDGCWMWMGRVEANGYARIGFYAGGGRAAPGRGAKNKEVHRVAFEVFKCEHIPEGHDVDHSCRFTLCINPAHLRAVPAAQNRSWGARNGNAKRRAGLST